MTECTNTSQEVDETNESTTSTIELEPFIHQVGGRSAILVLGKYICKPINERELTFYQTLDQYAPSLESFVPHFNGVISVNFSESNDGYLMITTKTTNLQESSCKHQSTPGDSAGSNSSSVILQSPSSPYQKFVTKYRVKLCRPMREVIIESHEEDLPNDVSRDLECSKQQLEHLLITNRGNSFDNGFSCRPRSLNVTNSMPSSQASTNLCRSRSTSISIPNFEDGNFDQTDLTSLFDNQLFVNEAGQNGYSHTHHQNANFQSSASHRNTSSPNTQSSVPQFSRQSSVHSSPTRKNVLPKSTTKHNPWVLKTFSALSELNESTKEQRFIMLENLVANFEYPCIMDLKMGNRLHDDDASQTKMESHQSKVNETTSGVLGLRITGIQFYDTNLERFICYNKYYGRKLTPESFRSSLKMFVSNENFVDHKLMNVLLDKLKKLRSVIVELDTFRFYTSSLLLIYEGNTCKASNTGGDVNSITSEGCTFSHDPSELIDVRMIDFAHSTHKSSNTTGGQDYDQGFVFGLDNLIKILTMFQNESV